MYVRKHMLIRTYDRLQKVNVCNCNYNYIIHVGKIAITCNYNLA